MSGKMFIALTWLLLVFCAAMVMDFIGVIDVFPFVEPSETFWSELITKMADSIVENGNLS